MHSRPASLSALLLYIAVCAESLSAAEITPFGAFRTGGEFTDATSGNTLDIDNTGAFGFFIGMPYQRDSDFEFFFSHQNSSLVEKTGTGAKRLFDLEINYFQFGGTSSFNTTPRITPFVSGGLGFSWFSPGLDGLDSELRPALGIGGGLKIKLDDNLGMRFELRGTGTFFGNGSSIFCSNGQCAANLRGELLFQMDALFGVYFGF